MEPKIFPTQEIGSLSKPPWLINYLRGKPVRQADLEHFSKWSTISRFEAHDEVLAILRGSRKEENEKQIRRLASLLATRFLESSGLDYVYDGEMNRIEMYEHAIRNINGFEFYGHVRSFDNRYYRKASCTGEIELKQAYHLAEFLYVKEKARRKIKVPVTGAYTLADWSFNEFYQEKLASKFKDLKKLKSEAKRELVLRLAREIIRPNIEALVKAGSSWIQIDEPAATTKLEEIPLFVEAFNASTDKIQCKFSVHICYGNYRALYPSIMDMRNCKQLALEFANRENQGKNPYDMLNLLKEYDDRREIGLGVVDVHSDAIETPDEIAKRAYRALKILEDPERIYLNPDCGLRTRTWDVAYAKLRNMVIAAERTRKQAN